MEIHKLKNLSFTVVSAAYFQGRIIIISYCHFVWCTFKGGLQPNKYGTVERAKHLQDPSLPQKISAN